MSINLTKHIHEPITIAQTENRIDKNNDNQTPRQFQIKSDHFDWIQKQEITQQRNSRLKQVNYIILDKIPSHTRRMQAILTICCHLNYLYFVFCLFFSFRYVNNLRKLRRKFVIIFEMRNNINCKLSTI